MNKIKACLNKKSLFTFLMLTLGSLITAAGVYFFKVPNHFSMGGFSGLSILLGKLLPVNTSTLISVLNWVSLVLGFAFLGKGVGGKTVYCTLLYTGFINLFEFIIPMEKPFTDEIVLELIMASMLGAIGAGILFKYGGSSGGTDIIALIFRKYTSADISISLMIADGIIVAASFFVFDIKTGLCSVIGMLMKTSLVQFVVDALNRRKSLIIITSKPDEITKYITETLHRSATIWNAHGAFIDADKFTIYTAMTPYQAAKLKDFAKSVDEHAFVTINKTSEIYGKGFLPFGKK